MYTISHAAALTGVPVATLRAWERRYAVVTPTRTEAGYRLYDDQALQLLSAMGALVAAGWSPRQAAEHLLAGRAGAADEPSGDRASGDRGSGDRGSGDRGSGVEVETTVGLDLGALSRGAADHDPRAIERTLDEAFAVGGFERVVDEWLLPALRVLGADWQSGAVDVAGEHLVSATVHRRLGAALDAAGRAARAPRVAVGLPHGSRHELGVLAFAVVLRRAGIDVVYLGADLPPENWVAAVRRHQPAAVVLAAATRIDVVPVRETVAALRGASPELGIYVGGSAQDEVRAGAVTLGHSLRRAAEVITGSLSPA
ncbi:cobalamin B12-binding domain-containing protein [Nostocoides sp. HKS02]|uniref:MerR family transcriptional regulator n=1 Tax=Nostocoides sp. HKS02 TaxID=1813880 RepID=UPI0012B472C7|nr:cobalamin B12-binding domain-containing protein [Tetrasphaera sp. HKS02]QGN57994.1 MerR family transcriptional regulator [Tetrasphaera sp. HKS02]